MRKAIKTIVIIAIIAGVVLLVGPALLSIFGGGFDPR